MMLSTRQIIYLLLISIALGFSGWFYIRTQALDNLTPNINKNAPNAFTNQLHIIRYDKTGKIVSKLFTPKLIHYPNDNRSYFYKPFVILYQENSPPWTIRANRGRALKGDTEIKFWDHVVLHQDQGKKNEATTITTTELTYIPKKKIVKTLEQIKFKQPGLTITSKGMNAFLADNRIDLLSHADGKYRS